MCNVKHIVIVDNREDFRGREYKSDVLEILTKTSLQTNKYEKKIFIKNTKEINFPLLN